jgi:NAD(P)-dependent dehydrogenase (short-subunit alcohol dehydrogenase family)
MTSASSNSDAATRAKASPVPQPPSWWRIWQALKGTNFRHLNVPAADLRNKRVLITGGNSGIGYEAALQFARWGAHVVLACLPLPPAHEMRPDAAVEQCRAAAREGGHLDTEIEWWGCDMACLKDVQALGMRWLQTDRPLDLLVNNVGITNDDQGIRFTQDGFEMIHQVGIPPSACALCGVRSALTFEFLRPR